MADIKILGADEAGGCEGEGGERGERGRRGERGPRGRDGHDGAAGPVGPAGPTGPTGPSDGPVGPTGPTGAGVVGPTGPTGPTSGGPPILGVASIDGSTGNAFVSSPEILETARLGVGQYSITLVNPPPDDGIIPVAMIRNPSTNTADVIGFPVGSVQGGVVFISTIDLSTGAPADVDFFVIITNGLV